MKLHTDNPKGKSNNESLVVSQLCEAAAALGKGIGGIGIQRILLEPQIQYVITTLRDGDDSAIANLIVNVSGQTSSLYNATSLHGAQALEAIAHGYAQVFIDVRNRCSLLQDTKDQIQTIVGLLDQVQNILLRCKMRRLSLRCCFLSCVPRPKRWILIQMKDSQLLFLELHTAPSLRATGHHGCSRL